MKTILLPYHDEDAGRGALETAIHLAHRFESYLEGLVVLPAPPISVAPGMALSPDYLATLANDIRRFAATARDHFLSVTGEHGLTFGNAETEGAAVGWREVDGREPDAVGRIGRAFDLIVLGRTTSTPNGRWHDTCQAALFESGRPVLIAPHRAPASIGRRVLVAWNGSTETARTLSLAMPILARAEHVVVASVSGHGVAGPDAIEIASHLRRHGCRAIARSIDAGRLPAGEAVLVDAGEMDADLIIKGAFTRSRLRQIIFGGMTEHILEHARVPLLMAH